MKLDVSLYPSKDFRADANVIRQAESLGYDAAWTTENARNPFFALTIAAAETRKIRLGTHAALAFPRSPMVTAQIAWDLAQQSGGRFMLGLDTGLGRHIAIPESEDFQVQVERMREYIESLRAIWDTFQTDARLRYRGEHYTFRLMAPFFNPGPIEHPNIPVFLTGANPTLCELAGELCQGLHAPALHTRDYLRDVLLPALSSGLASAGRARRDVELALPVFIVSGLDETEFLRAKYEAIKQIAALARSPANRSIIEHLDWKKIAEELNALAASERWGDLAEVITDNALGEVAVVADPQDVLCQIRERYSGIADRVCMIVSRESGRLIKTIMRA